MIFCFVVELADWSCNNSRELGVLEKPLADLDDMIGSAHHRNVGILFHQLPQVLQLGSECILPHIPYPVAAVVTLPIAAHLPIMHAPVAVQRQLPSSRKAHLGLMAGETGSPSVGQPCPFKATVIETGARYSDPGHEAWMAANAGSLELDTIVRILVELARLLVVRILRLL